jgi:hypothetical protein
MRSAEFRAQSCAQPRDRGSDQRKEGLRVSVGLAPSPTEY